MQKLECSHCHQKTIPVWRKQVLGAATHVTCSGCGGKVSVPVGASFAAAIPIITAVVLAALTKSYLADGALIFVGVLLTGWLYHRYVPLIAK